MRYKISNWGDYQHYKDRCPPWIKLHHSLITSEVWVMGDDASRSLAVACMLLASRDNANDGSFNGDPEYIKRFAYLNSKPDFNHLIKHGFIEVLHNASKVIAECDTEKSREETEQSRADMQCPVEKIVDAYHRLMPANPKCKVINTARRGAIKSRWNEAAKLTCTPFGYSSSADGIAAWEVFFETCANSKFLTGQAAPQAGKPPFIADIDFLMAPSSFAKCLENKYHRD